MYDVVCMCICVHMYTRYYKVLNLKVRIAIKSKERGSYPIRNSYYYSPAVATVSLTICSQMHVQIMNSLAYLQDLITTLASIYVIYK